MNDDDYYQIVRIDFTELYFSLSINKIDIILGYKSYFSSSRLLLNTGIYTYPYTN
jgi:hypothetical protein